MIEDKIRKNISLAPLTTFKIGGPARYFLEIKNMDEIIAGLQWARQNNIPYFILGGGSNILISDKGFNGLVIKMQNLKIKMQNDNSKCKIFAGTGVSLAKLVSASVRAGLTGLEWLAGIPGTVGGAIKGNAGAWGHAIGDVVEKVETVSDKGMVKQWDKQKCQFTYRESIFKQNQNLIIVSTELNLASADKKDLKQRIKECLNKRSGQPSEPSAGCVFKNPKIANIHEFEHKFHELDDKFVKIRGQFVPIRDGKIPAGWLIENCGLKGMKIGQAQISAKHANFIVNLGGATAEDVKKLITLIKQKVAEKFNIQLAEEIIYVGHFAN